jgi:hypothetical protein
MDGTSPIAEDIGRQVCDESFKHLNLELISL